MLDDMDFMTRDVSALLVELASGGYIALDRGAIIAVEYSPPDGGVQLRSKGAPTHPKSDVGVLAVKYEDGEVEYFYPNDEGEQ